MKEKNNKEKDIENNSEKYYSLDGESNKNECKECVCTFIKDSTIIVFPYLCLVGILALVIFDLKYLKN